MLGFLSDLKSQPTAVLQHLELLRCMVPHWKAFNQCPLACLLVKSISAQGDLVNQDLLDQPFNRFSTHLLGVIFGNCTN